MAWVTQPVELILLRQAASYLAIAVLRGRTSVLLARAPGREGSASDFQVGKANPLHASASVKLFLAMMTAAQREEMLSALGDLRRFTANTIVDPDRFRDELDHIREGGYALDSSELYDSYRSLAVPIRQADGSVSAALCVGGWKTPDSTAMEETLLREIRSVVAACTRSRAPSTEEDPDGKDLIGRR